MNLKELYKNKSPLSFEIFPPKTEKGLANLYNELDILSQYNPAFISVTYGAGGSTRERTFDLAIEIKNRYNVDPVVHFTCVSHSQDEIQEYLEKIKANGIKNILALRGDPPEGEDKFTPTKDGFHYANELVDFISKINGFDIAVAGYPEGHTEAIDFKTDILNLKRKVDAGASIIITQLFFDNNDFFNFEKEARKSGITVPIIPGIMPITSVAQIEKITELCGAKIPEELSSQLSKCNSENNACEAGIEYSIKQCEELKKHGVSGFHFYPLNKAYATKKIIDSLNLKK